MAESVAVRKLVLAGILSLTIVSPLTAGDYIDRFFLVADSSEAGNVRASGWYSCSVDGKEKRGPCHTEINENGLFLVYRDTGLGKDEDVTIHAQILKPGCGRRDFKFKLSERKKFPVRKGVRALEANFDCVEKAQTMDVFGNYGEGTVFVPAKIGPNDWVPSTHEISNMEWELIKYVPEAHRKHAGSKGGPLPCDLKDYKRQYRGTYVKGRKTIEVQLLCGDRAGWKDAWSDIMDGGAFVINLKFGMGMRKFYDYEENGEV